jgi:ribonuclease HII
MTDVIGIDEVGRGSWAGPLLVVAARAKNDLPPGLKDSKLLSKKQRQEFLEQIKMVCSFGEGWVQPEEVDRLGLTKAMKLGVARALIELAADYQDHIIIDGNINYCPEEFVNAKAVIKADNSHPIVSAASIYAKELRDQHMIRLAQIYPDYGFDQHVGYGTDLHHLMLKVYGPSKIHRLSFKPVMSLAIVNDKLLKRA